VIPARAPPTSVIAAHGKPGLVVRLVKAHEAGGEFGPGDLEEMFDDAVDTAVRDMEEAGIDVITDGEARRTDGYVDTYYKIIKNIAPLPVQRKAGPWGYDMQQRTRRWAASRRRPRARAREGLRVPACPHDEAREGDVRGPLTFGSRIHPARRTRAWWRWPSASRKSSTSS